MRDATTRQSKLTTPLGLEMQKTCRRVFIETKSRAISNLRKYLDILRMEQLIFTCDDCGRARRWGFLRAKLRQYNKQHPGKRQPASAFPRGLNRALATARRPRANITQAQPLKIISMPMNRPMTHNAASGNWRLMMMPNSKVTPPLSSTQPQSWNRTGSAETMRNRTADDQEDGDNFVNSTI